MSTGCYECTLNINFGVSRAGRNEYEQEHVLEHDATAPEFR